MRDPKTRPCPRCGQPTEYPPSPGYVMTEDLAETIDALLEKADTLENMFVDPGYLTASRERGCSFYDVIEDEIGGDVELDWIVRRLLKNVDLLTEFNGYMDNLKDEKEALQKAEVAEYEEARAEALEDARTEVVRVIAARGKNGGTE